MASVAAESFFAVDPVELEIGLAPPGRQKRGSVLLRGLLVLPQLLAVLVLTVAGAVLAVIGWVAALGLGRLPRWIAVFQLDAIGYSVRAQAYASLLLDDYPPFSLPHVDFPITVEVRAARLSRLKILFRWPLAIPAAVVSAIAWSGGLALNPLPRITVGLGSAILTLILGSAIPAAIVSAVAWLGLLVFSPVIWIVTLVLGKSPQPVFTAAAAVIRYKARCSAYAGFVTDVYPRRLFGDPESEWASERFRLSLPEAATWLTGLVVCLGIAGVIGGVILQHELTLPPPRNPAVVAAEGRVSNAGMNAVSIGHCTLQCEKSHERALGAAYLGLASTLSRVAFPVAQRGKVAVLIVDSREIGQKLLAASKSRDAGRSRGWDPADPGDSNGLDYFDNAIESVLGPMP